jgi:hypothetical protein
MHRLLTAFAGPVVAREAVALARGRRHYLPAPVEPVGEQHDMGQDRSQRKNHAHSLALPTSLHVRLGSCNSRNIAGG